MLPGTNTAKGVRLIALLGLLSFESYGQVAKTKIPRHRPDLNSYTLEANPSRRIGRRSVALTGAHPVRRNTETCVKNNLTPIVLTHYFDLSAVEPLAPEPQNRGKPCATEPIASAEGSHYLAMRTTEAAAQQLASITPQDAEVKLDRPVERGDQLANAPAPQPIGLADSANQRRYLPTMALAKAALLLGFLGLLIRGLLHVFGFKRFGEKVESLSQRLLTVEQASTLSQAPEVADTPAESRPSLGGETLIRSGPAPEVAQAPCIGGGGNARSLSGAAEAPQVSVRLDKMVRALEGWGRLLPAAALGDLDREALEQQLGEVVGRLGHLRPGDEEIWLRHSESAAVTVLLAADSTVDRCRSSESVQDAVKAVLDAAGLQLVDPPRNSDPCACQAKVLGPIRARSPNDSPGCIAKVEHRGLKREGEFICYPTVRVFSD